MNTHSISVIDGPVSAEFWERVQNQPSPVTDPNLTSVLNELITREPIFHRPDRGHTPQDFEKMTAPEFWEVGASGRRYNRELVLAALATRYENPVTTTWEIGNFYCQQIAPANYLLTYTLIQGQRRTHRATLWRQVGADWQVVYHQGTVIS